MPVGARRSTTICSEIFGTRRKSRGWVSVRRIAMQGATLGCWAPWRGSLCLQAQTSPAFSSAALKCLFLQPGAELGKPWEDPLHEGSSSILSLHSTDTLNVRCGAGGSVAGVAPLNQFLTPSCCLYPAPFGRGMVSGRDLGKDCPPEGFVSCWR